MFADTDFQKYPPTYIISTFVKNMNTTRFLYFDLNSKKIVANIGESGLVG